MLVSMSDRVREKDSESGDCTDKMETEAVGVSTDDFLKSLGGCGTFQILFSTFVILPQLTCAFSTIFMAFGSYNPGWRCLDDDENITVIKNTSYYPHRITTHSIKHANTLNASSSSLKTTDLRNTTYDFYTDDDTESMCKEFNSCETIYFDPTASTIATEWELLCDRSWILSLITSLQMAGTLIGAMVVGYLGDTYGRKWTLYSSVAINAILQIVSTLSNSWQMFAGLKLVIGITNGVISFLPHAYISEFVIQKWRCVTGSLPVWTLGTVIFSVAGMMIKDWRLLHAVNAGISALCFLPVFWVPESLRWLMIRQKMDKSIRVVRDITRLNKISWVPVVVELRQISAKLKLDVERKNWISKGAMVLQLFTKSRWVISLVVGVVWFTIDLVYFVTSFVIPDLPGNFYTNLIVISAMDLPGNAIASVIPNIIGRKRSLIAMFSMLSLSLFLVIVAEKCLARGNNDASSTYYTIAVLVLTILARTFQNVAYCVLVVYVNEMYPTIIRSTANGYGGFVASIGSMLAPYLLPTFSGSFYVSYLILGAAALVCTFLILLLPETKGEQMQDI